METQAAQIQKKLQIELDSFKATQKGEFPLLSPLKRIFRLTVSKCFSFSIFLADYSKMVQQRQLLDGQLNENKSVLDELNKLTEDKNTVRRNF